MKTNLIKYVKAVLLLSAFVFFWSCLRGTPSEKPAIHLNPNMDDQNRYDAQEESKFFANKRVNRDLVEGTVARGELRGDDAYYLGIDASGKNLKSIPIQVSKELMLRGQERYNIYCSPCHGRAGDGKGIVPKRGFLPPPTFHQEKIRAFEDGYIYQIISNGVRNMPAYKKQIPVHDRWAIVAYVRALQRTQNASASDIPQDKINELNQR